jgi:serine-type D-Ala-D-Ala carboxypeptidase/endopeptidase (penicillin-binding protein 4)
MMQFHIKRRKFQVACLLLFFSLITPTVFTQNNVENAIQTFANNSYFQNASISFHAINLENHEVIASYNSNTSLPPASTIKLFSTATAFEILGPTYQPKTRIYYQGDISKEGILNGDLIVRGGGDPTLGSRFFNEDGNENNSLEKWVDSLLKMGVNSITGNIIADGSEFGYNATPDGWTWSDMGNYYGAGPSGIPIYDNMLKYYFKTSSSVGVPSHLTHTFPEVDNFRFHNYINSSKRSGDNSYIYGAPYSLDRFGTGTLPINRSVFMVKGSLPDPEKQFAFELLRTLNSKGIKVQGKAICQRENNEKTNYSNAKLILTHYGPSLQEIATLTNMKSINFFAEQILCLIGYEEKGDGSTETSISTLENFWKEKINIKGCHITDGSGLSRSNAVSASHFCELLSYMNKSKMAKSFYETLPISGESGTLSGVCRNQVGHGRVHAKSGTINRIKAYAGYVESKSGKKIAFALIINNFNCSSSYTVDQMEKVFNAMASY